MQSPLPPDPQFDTAVHEMSGGEMYVICMGYIICVHVYITDWLL